MYTCLCVLVVESALARVLSIRSVATKGLVGSKLLFRVILIEGVHVKCAQQWTDAA